MAGRKSFLDDQESLKALVNRMPAPARAEYEGYRALALESAYPDRRMIIYEVRDRNPKNLVDIIFGPLAIDNESGPSATVFDGTGWGLVTSQPRKMPGREVFLQMPQNFIVKYKGRIRADGRLEFASHYAVLVKTRSKPNHCLEGHTYCVTPGRFREQFPDYRP